MKAVDRKLLSTAVVGDGGASWRLKALKRAQAQAAREGRKLQEVVEERWGSMGHLVASCGVAPTHAHLHAIKNRRKRLRDELKTIDEENDNTEKDIGQKSQKDVHPRHPKMKMPKVHDSLSWGKRRSKKLSAENTALISAATSSLNKFSNYGNFMAQFVSKEEKCGDHSNSSKSEVRLEPKLVDYVSGENKFPGTLQPATSANQLAAKALQLRMKGKHEEAEKLLEEVENINVRQSIGTKSSRWQIDGTTSSCRFCFENPTRPKHLVISIANFSYLSLPHQRPVVPDHCGISTMQHESSTRIVDDNVWDEIRNFKKCLVMMFGKQEKDVVFCETVMGLAQQRRHCLVECIPLPRDIAKQAPVYFKKAIDEAEDEWSQHNAKKLIDTSEKGLRGSIPKNFPYFHVEFGLNRGFVHVIDDEKEFKSSFGLDVIRGMLCLPAEDMHQRRRHETVEVQKQAVVTFARDWEQFDWTKQLE